MSRIVHKKKTIKHLFMSQVVSGNHRRRTMDERRSADRKEMVEILSDWFSNEEEEGVKKDWRSRETIVMKLIEIFKDSNVRCFPLASKLAKTWVRNTSGVCLITDFQKLDPTTQPLDMKTSDVVREEPMDPPASPVVAMAGLQKDGNGGNVFPANLRFWQPLLASQLK